MSDFKEIAGETINRGEIYWFRYGNDAEGSEQSGTRPCVVVSNNKANQYGKTVTIVPFTTADKKKLPTHIDVDSGLESSIALCEQVKTISKDRLSRYIGECTEEELKAIEGGLCIQLGIEKTTLKVQKVQSPVVMQMSTHPIEPPAPALNLTELTELRQRLTREQTRADIFERLYQDLTEKLTR